nr:glycosyltransferase family 2 protein [Nocardioides sp. B-3]
MGHGLNHLVVVTDGPPDTDVHTILAQHPQVSLVVTNDAWWGDDYIETLNGRQRVAANLVRVACAEVGNIDWLFFLDGDEVALLDLDVLRQVPAEAPAVRLWPLESVAQHSSDAGRVFKRLLTKRELRSLRRAGLLERANNARFFHGHVSGKVGIRPRPDTRLGVHAAEDDRGNKLEAYEDAALRHLHFESPTFDEFVRKWTALAASGPPPAMRDRRAEVLRAFPDVQNVDDPAVADDRLRSLYDDFVLEDTDALDAFGVLERIEVSVPTWTPTPMPSQVLIELEHQIHRHEQLPKRLFLPATRTTEFVAARRAVEVQKATGEAAS